MKFSIQRRFYTKKFVISEFYVNDKFITFLKETILNDNIKSVLPNGKYEIKQYFSVKKRRIVYGIKDDAKLVFVDYPKYKIIQNKGDFDALIGIKFPYRFSQRKYTININS